MRRRLVVGLVALGIALGSLGAAAPQAQARKLIGCNSVLNWPCPGPVP